MSIEDRMSAMQKLADTLTDAASMLTDSSEILGKWCELADDHDPDDITCKLYELEAWERLESVHGDVDDIETKLDLLSEWEEVESAFGLVAGEVEEKLEELREWEDISDDHGSPDEVKSKLEEHGSLDFEEMKTLLAKTNDRVEELAAVGHKLEEDFDEVYEKYTKAKDSAAKAWEEGAHQWAELTALKNRTRWQTFLSLFTGRN